MRVILSTDNAFMFFFKNFETEKKNKFFEITNDKKKMKKESEHNYRKMTFSVRREGGSFSYLGRREKEESLSARNGRGLKGLG